MNRLKRHLSVANVLSLTALFVALGGSAYAATKLSAGQVKAVNIAKQAVTNPKIKTQAVTSGKIKNLGVKAADLAASSVASSKVRSKAVTNSKLAYEAVGTNKIKKKAVTESRLGAESVATGKLRNEAVTAAKVSSATWGQIVKNVTYESATSVNDSQTEKSVTVSCPPGKEVIGGGARINSPVSVKVAVNASYPAVAGDNSRYGWIASGRETPEESGNWQIVAYAVCAEL